MERREITFRVFVSSTFSDLKAERDALQKDVFPRLLEYCQKHGCRFQAIDLRWGVSNEAAADQSTMRICRAEIARCQAVTPRPNFVVLLGDRHGWRPLPDEIPAAEFDALLPHLPAELANRWYKLDENTVCPRPDGTGPDKGVYVLQSRAGAGKWAEEVEGPLCDAFRRAARAVGLPEAVRVEPFFVSLLSERYGWIPNTVRPGVHFKSDFSRRGASARRGKVSLGALPPLADAGTKYEHSHVKCP